MASNTIEEAINYKLRSDTAVHDVIGDKIFFVDAPPKTARPYLTFFVVDDPHDPFTFDLLDAGQPRVQFNVYDDNRFVALESAKTVRADMERYAGAIDGKTVERIRCGGIKTLKIEDDNTYQATFDGLIHYYD